MTEKKIMNTDDFDDSLDEEDIEIAKPTPMMKVWIRDAEEFGIPFEVQKGLIFLIAFGLRSIFQPLKNPEKDKPPSTIKYWCSAIV